MGSELGKSGRAPASTVEMAFREGMPELWENPDRDAAEFHHSYVATYLERDLRMLLDVGSHRDFERFLRASSSTERDGSISWTRSGARTPMPGRRQGTVRRTAAPAGSTR
jgi:hypothetical protein